MTWSKQGVVNVPVWGLVSHHQTKYLLEMNYIPNSWVMWNRTGHRNQALQKKRIPLDILTFNISFPFIFQLAKKWPEANSPLGAHWGPLQRILREEMRIQPPTSEVFSAKLGTPGGPREGPGRVPVLSTSDDGHSFHTKLILIFYKLIWVSMFDE